MNRREFLEAAALSALASSACTGAGRGALAGVELNDVHSQLNATRVARVVPVDSLASLRDAVRAARRAGQSLSIAGGRHAMGGQQFGADTLHVDTRPLRRILAFDQERGRLHVEAGIQWPELIDGYLRAQAGRAEAWGIAQKQTGADRLSIGGALSANVHGRGLTLAPIGAEIESFTLVDAAGELRRASRSENAELFALALGGYGLIGAVYSVELRLVRRRKLERVVEVQHADHLVEAFAQRIRDGYLYGDFQFETDARSPGFLTRGVFSCYRPVDPATPIPAGQRQLSERDWTDLFQLAHADKSQAFERYARYYLATSGQLYWSDTQQLGYYPDGYHAPLDGRLGARTRSSEMISELYVPRAALAEFLRAAAATLAEQQASVIYGTIRLIERDVDALLAWAREPWACVIFNLHVEHSPAGLARALASFRSLIELARVRGGSYYLTYHRWATREQVEACHPRMPEFLRRKLAHDPDERFQSEWYRHYRAMFADVL